MQTNSTTAAADIEILYREAIGPVTVTIGKTAGLWTCQLVDSHANIERERVYYATASDPTGYERAIKQYDATCDAAARIYNTARPPMEAPKFTP